MFHAIVLVESKMATIITAYYRASKTFEIPKDVFLLSQDENEEAEEGTYGMWWIKYGIFFYVDKEKKVHEIHGDDDYYDVESKWPEDIEVETD